MTAPYDAFLVVSFGGPEGPAEVMPFLENVLRGRNVPKERMLEVAEHYQHFGGKSPINDQNRALLAAVEKELAAAGIKLPVYFGNRNWHPLLPDTLRQMKQDGVQRAVAFFTSAFNSYSGCRQYRENIAAAQEQVGEGAPQVDKLRVFFNHPGFIEPMVENTAAALSQIPEERRTKTQLLFTAHSIPLSMAATCKYELQLQEASRLVAAGVGRGDWRLVYQSRSGPPSQPWLEPDVGVALNEIAEAGGKDVVVVPIGFISDHMEVLFDLDKEAQNISQQLGLNMVRAATVGTHPRFVRMIVELVQERLGENPVRLAVGNLGPSHDVCPVDCCAYSPKRPAIE
ncbi:MAG: ferrochelatase [Pirellulaceae bacterium]|nr:ferrochelatase [Pirellulaceae bacterium]